MSKPQNTCLIIGALPNSLVNFRGPLLVRIREREIKVVAAANSHSPEVSAKLQSMGVEYCPIRICRASMNPLQDVIACIDLIRLIRRVKPQYVLSYTIKPVIYGGLAAWICGVPHIFSLITGLGYAFDGGRSWRKRMAARAAWWLYLITLRHSRKVFFQNPDDMCEFVQRNRTF